jgi:hypothetical protein
VVPHIQHSAGSGKSNSIAWPAHQLVGLEQESKAIFDLGYDEAWIGENHRAGGEILSSPGLFIAVAADRSYELLARYVMGQFQETALGTAASNTWAYERREVLRPDAPGRSSGLVRTTHDGTPGQALSAYACPASMLP